MYGFNSGSWSLRKWLKNKCDFHIIEDASCSDITKIQNLYSLRYTKLLHVIPMITKMKYTLDKMRFSCNRFFFWQFIHSTSNLKMVDGCRLSRPFSISLGSYFCTTRFLDAIRQNTFIEVDGSPRVNLLLIPQDCYYNPAVFQLKDFFRYFGITF